MTWFRGVIQSAKDTANGVKLLKAMGRGVRELKDVPLMQQRGFISVPVNGDTVLFLQSNDLAVAVATGSADKPMAESGETIVYSSKDCFLRFMPDGTVRIKAAKIVFGTDASPTPLSGIVTGECLDPVTGVPFPDTSAVVFASKMETP